MTGIPTKLVRYRTKDSDSYSYAVVPIIFQVRLISWLRSVNCEVVSITDNVQNVRPVVPINWEGKQECEAYVQTVSLLSR